MYLYLAILAVVVVFLLLKVHISRMKGVCRSEADLTGKTAVVTGATRGIGYEVALDLARRNARLIIACLNIDEGNRVMEAIQKLAGNKNIVLKQVDLASLSSVRKLAGEITEEESRVDILVNVAGVAGLPRRETEDKLEQTFAINFYGPFLLTNLLLDKLKKAAPSRIVNVTSIAHQWGAIDFDNLRGDKWFLMPRSYFDSKLAIILATREMGRQLKEAGVIVNCCHPGSVNTSFLDNMPFFVRMFTTPIGLLFWRTPREGAQTPIHLAVSEDVKDITGEYFSECKLDKPAKQALDDVVARKLVEASEKLVGLQ
ncbi:retinol dehydrogenase 13-like [Ptychodera flava]|uniref:retinol dehydrogenase 13-like n=1 Tax=Ptychodera flava TaxID=63121 RepID=UPI00396A1978